MKSILAYFLAFTMLFGSLLPQNDVTELQKLPQLVQHYRFHRSAEGGSLSPGEFLTLHYGPQSVTHFQCVQSAQHHIDHESLPLRNHHDGVVLSFLVPARPVVYPRALGWPATAYRPSGHPLYAFTFSASLLLPPRA